MKLIATAVIAGMFGLTPLAASAQSPSLSEQVQQRNLDARELERSSGHPSNSPAPRGLPPSPSLSEQVDMRSKDARDLERTTGMPATARRPAA